jgi:hypothetical protein
MGGVKGGGGSAQMQQTGKGQGGMPQMQGNGGGGAMSNALGWGGSAGPMGMGGQPSQGGPPTQSFQSGPNPAMMQQMQHFMDMRNSQQGAMSKPPPGIAGLNNAMGNYNMPNRDDFMPGGALSAPLDLASVNPNPGGATPSSMGADMPPQMSAEAMGRMQGAMPQGMGGGYGGMRGWGGMRGGWGGGMGRFGGGMMGGRGMMNNGGIVALADGGMLGAPLSRGVVTRGAAPVVAPPMAGPPVAAAPAQIAWNPTAAPAGGGGSMFNNAALPPVVQPAAWTPPPQRTAIWTPPPQAAPVVPVAKAVAPRPTNNYGTSVTRGWGSNR